MVVPPIRSFLQSLPKCEHHMHLEGALQPSILFELAAKNSIALPQDDGAFASPEKLLERYNHFASLDDFLHYYYIGMSVLVNESDYETLAWDYFQHAARDGVAHAEVFFDPQAHLSRGVAYETFLGGFTAARQRAERELGITSELICCFLRHLPVAESVETWQLPDLQASLKRGDVAGIGLDSSEKPFPPQLFTELFADAVSKDIRRTAHAGEEGPAEYIASALDTLAVQRIDHGIGLAKDPELMARVAREGTLLTVCPLSNVFLRCVSDVGDLPIRAFLDAGVRFSINSDDPAYFGNHYILDNYCAVQDAFNLSITEWSLICENGIRGSWCSDSRKAEMLSQLKAAIRQWSESHETMTL